MKKELLRSNSHICGHRLVSNEDVDNLSLGFHNERTRNPVCARFGLENNSGVCETNEAMDDLSEAGSAGSVNVESDVCSKSDTGASGTQEPAERVDEFKLVQQLASRETKTIQIWRTIVALLILGTGAVAATGTYFYLFNQQLKEKDNAFKLFANDIEDASKLHFTNIFEACRVASRALTADAFVNNMTFPFVTSPMFEVYGKEARESAGMKSLSFTPIVFSTELSDFNDYTQAHLDWVEQTRVVGLEIDPTLNGTRYEYPIALFDVYTLVENEPMPVNGSGPFSPIWMESPPPINNWIMKYDTGSIPAYAAAQAAVQIVRESVFTTVNIERQWVDLLAGKTRHKHNPHSRLPTSKPEQNISQLYGEIFQPVFRTSDEETSDIVGYLSGVVSFDTFLARLLPQGVLGVFVVLESTCNNTYTYQIDGQNATYLGEGDRSDPTYHNQVRRIEFSENYQNYKLVATTPGHCEFSYRVHPSALFEESFTANLPIVETFVIGIIFVMMAITFFVYDRFVQIRNNKVVGAAARSNAIVSSLFPSNVRDRLFADREAQTKGYTPNKSHLRNFLNDEAQDPNDEDFIFKTKPIADLFTDTTICFADICGFTAWSSVREPSQVFTLLEAVYNAFDTIAKKRRIFKVETVGDCYVAVCGLPDPRKDHAIAMARFARACVCRMEILAKRLEVTLGPDTADLGLRVGLHSGPVTAGVLRGERSRFQLFGDTMNTASRMESTGIRGRVQISQETADLLSASGKGSWFEPRQDTVHAKGKGMLQTYWLIADLTKSDAAASTSGGSRSSDDIDVSGDKISRLIDWNVETLTRLLKQIKVQRDVTLMRFSGKKISPSFEKQVFHDDGQTVLDEVKEIIDIPRFDAKAALKREDPESVELEKAVVSQLLDFVSNIADMYRENAFHNFEHASHVAMAVGKLLSRIVAPSDLQYDDRSGVARKKKAESIASCLHDHTYGITSDPLTQFACVVSALIHDADHPGVSNAQLVKEQAATAIMYNNKSVAEQNSVDLAWNLLMEDQYTDLRSAIYTNESEMRRFRQLVVNSVMATDIMDKDLKELRNNRWDRAFNEACAAVVAESEQDRVSRKATIVIEHLIQASDVSHTMQHWHVYRKWNESFFMECYQAYKEGRAETDPSVGWYKGELGFFDFYIIPLAKKLKDCGVFGVSSDEFLSYAIRNRQEWEVRGQEIVSAMIEKASKAGTPDSDNDIVLSVVATDALDDC